MSNRFIVLSSAKMTVVLIIVPGCDAVRLIINSCLTQSPFDTALTDVSTTVNET